MNRPTRIGVIGTGAIARKHFAAAQVIPEDVEIVAICDPNQIALEGAAKEAPGARLFASMNDLLESGEIDAGIVATPHFLHAEQAQAFARASIPVLVEKPLVMNIDELRSLRDVAAANNALIVAGQMHRFDRTNLLARRWLDENPDEFGELLSFEMHCWQDITEYAGQVGLNHWLLDGRLAGGGVIVSLSVHQLDIVRFLGGTNYKQVSAKGSFQPPFHDGAESSASVLVTMANGAIGTIFANYNAPRAFSSESFSLFGTGGGIGRQNRTLGQYLGPLLWAPAHDANGVIDLSEIAELGNDPLAELVADLTPDRFANQLRHFARAVRRETMPVNTLAENFNTIACIDAINKSLLLEGAPVEVPTL